LATEKITMPQLGESVTEGKVNTWLVKVGDYVNKYDPIADIMTDKVSAEVPSSFSGTIKEIIAKEGDTIEVGEVMCYIETDASSSNLHTTAENETSFNTAPTSAVDRNKEKSPDKSMKKRYSPAVMRLAQEHGIDLNKVEGTGR